MSIQKAEFQAILEAKFPDSDVTLDELAGDGDHYGADITSGEFTGMTLIQMHRLVNKRLDGILGTQVHAVTFKLKAK